MAIEQQMNMLARGGLDDDGMSRDPVSGNTIPAGSMANEVRDDVDAKLSDGEYVVPANVVRFFGVKFFEDLRTQAMQGLGTMEANGRIGGEPMPSAMPMQDQLANSSEELSEQDMAMLQNIMNEGGDVRGYAHGGFHETPENASTAYNPLQYPLTQYATPGASVYNPNLNPNVQALEQTQTAAPTPAGSESTFVTFVNPRTGTIQVLQYINGEPANMGAYNSLIEQGFFVQGGPELAAYNQQQNEDNRKADDAMGGDKPKTLQNLIDSGIYGGMSLGPGASIAGGIIGKMFPTASNQDIIDFILENNGKLPDTGRGIVVKNADGTDAVRPGGAPLFEVHESGPLKGLLLRAPGPDGEVRLSEAELAYLNVVEDFKKANMKDGALDYKGLRVDGLKSNIYKEGDGITGKFNLRSLSPTEIIEWYKTQEKKTKPKVVNPVAGGKVGSSSVITPTYGNVSTSEALAASEAAGEAFKKSAEAKIKAGFRNKDDDNDNRPIASGSLGTERGNAQFVKDANISKPAARDASGKISGDTRTSTDLGYREDAGYGLLNKGGLIKKPKKKKTKKY